MKTEDIRRAAINAGLDAICSTYPSHSTCYGDGSLHSETVVESFTISVEDGSRFLISITKLKDKAP